MEDLLMQLDDLGVTYTEDLEMGTVVIDIASVEKDVLVDIIMLLNDGMYAFNITDTEITVEGGDVTTEDESTEDFDEETYLNDALESM
jgi:hypothetical protein